MLYRNYLKKETKQNEDNNIMAEHKYFNLNNIGFAFDSYEIGDILHFYNQQTNIYHFNNLLKKYIYILFVIISKFYQTNYIEKLHSNFTEYQIQILQMVREKESILRVILNYNQQQQELQMQQYLENSSCVRQRIQQGASMCPSKQYPMMIFKCGLLFNKIPDISQVFTFSQSLEFLKAQNKISNTIYGHFYMFMYENPQLYKQILQILDKLIQNKPVNILIEIEKLDNLKQLMDRKNNELNPQSSKTYSDCAQQRQQKLTKTGTVIYNQPHNHVPQNIQQDNHSQKTQKYDDEYFEKMDKLNMQSQALAKKLQQQQQKLAKSQKVNQDTVCQVCYVGLYDQEFVPLETCQHIFHKNCLSEYFKAEISENRFPLKCPNDECKLEIKDSDIKQILATQLYSKYEKHTLKHYADMHGDSISWCPTANCQYMFFFEKQDNPRFVCLQCKKQYCLNCRCDWHKQMSCKQYQITNTHSASDDAFMKFVTGKKFKQCPKCKFWVQKNEGCDHMTCKCKFQFCYKCGGVYMKCECMQKMKEDMERRRQQAQQRRRKKLQKKKKVAPPPPPPQPRSRRKR